MRVIAPVHSEQRPALPSVESGWTDVGPAHESLLDYWDILFAHRKTVLCVALTGLVAAVLIGLAQTPRYRARTSLEIQNFNDKFLDLNSVDPTVPGVDFPTGPSYLQTQVVMLQSETLLERVIEKLNPQEAKPAGLAGVRRMLGRSVSPLMTKEELIRQAKDNLTVRTARDTRVLEPRLHLAQMDGQAFGLALEHLQFHLFAVFHELADEAVRKGRRHRRIR